MIIKPSTALVLAGIFFAGAVTGAVVTLGVLRHFMPRPPFMERFATRQVERLDAALQLTAEQRVKVEQLVQQTGEELSKLRHQSWSESAQRIRAMNTKIAALLNREQLEKFTIFQKEQEERLEHMRRGPPGFGHSPDQSGRPPGAPPGDEPPPGSGPGPAAPP